MYRFVSIVYPVYHRNKITKKKFTIATIITINFNMIMTVLSFFFNGFLDTFIMIVFPLYATLVVAAYTKIFLVASRKNRVSPEVNEENMSRSERKKKRTVLKDFKLAKACLLVVVCYFICVLPGPLSYVLLKHVVNWQIQNIVAILGVICHILKFRSKCFHFLLEEFNVTTRSQKDVTECLAYIYKRPGHHGIFVDRNNSDMVGIRSEPQCL